MAVNSSAAYKIAGLAVVSATVLVGLLACATRGLGNGGTEQPFLDGVVVDERTGSGIPGVHVALCGVGPHRSFVRGNVYPTCGAEVTSAITDGGGRFRLTWNADSSSAAGASVAFIATGYTPQHLPNDVFTSAGSLHERTVKLRRAPLVELTLVDASGKPMRGAGGGWFVERAEAIQLAYQSCCSDDLGRMSFGPDGVPEGRITFFSAAGGMEGRLATVGASTIVTSAGSSYSVTLQVSQPLQRLHGHVVDSDGAPLAALVSVESAEPGALSALDRALLEIRGTNTDLEGGFDFRIASPAAVEVRLSTWGGLDEAGPSHVWLSPLAAVMARFGPKNDPITLKAPVARIVRCTMTGPDNMRVGIEELSIFFAPHKVSGHSGGCARIGELPQDDEKGRGPRPREVRFIWPNGARSLVVTARSSSTPSSADVAGESQPLVGEAVLDAATSTCEMHGTQPMIP